MIQGLLSVVNRLEKQTKRFGFQKTKRVKTNENVHYELLKKKLFPS